MRKIFLGFIFILIFGLIIASIIKGYEIKNDIENNGKASVGKYIKREWGKEPSNIIRYYDNGKEYESDGGRAPQGFEKNIGRFYRISYSEKYKGSLHADFTHEVTDTAEILNAGFRLIDGKIR
ncbi:hypothetical protein [Flavobacterium suzhouense]|uniref:Uncharacterized protein n=1 Tax=Flavobacterium suzhouense TaxID=1529638 RepID=A0ABW5NUD7_9FLAO